MTWLGNKPEPEPTPAPRASVPYTPTVTTEPANRPAPVERAAVHTGATIGKSILVKGELTGSEDLHIEGKVEGKISLNGYRVTIGASGQVTAEIVAKSVVVAGQVKGSIRADERVEVAATGTLLGDVRSPRVVLADGGRFKGAIDMDASSGSGSGATVSASKSAGSSAAVRDETPAYAGARES